MGGNGVCGVGTGASEQVYRMVNVMYLTLRPIASGGGRIMGVEIGISNVLWKLAEDSFVRRSWVDEPEERM